MPLYTFREVRTGKLKAIGGADDAISALDALTIYPWAFELVDIRPLSKNPPYSNGKLLPGEKLSAPADEVTMVRLYSAKKRTEMMNRVEGF